MPEKTCIMISSTARDLPEHRKDVLEACLRQGMEPMRMERQPESDAEAVRLTLEMAERAHRAGRSRFLRRMRSTC